MNISAVSSSSYSPKPAQLQSAKPPTVVAAPDPDRDGDTDKVGRPDTNDRRRGSVGSLLNTTA